MGTLASAYCTDAGAKVVLFKKSRKGFVFQENLTLQPGSYKFPELYLSYFYPDLVLETVRIPPVKDEGTINILIKKKLADTLGLTGNYLVVFEELLEESAPTEKVFRVFAIPEEVYRDESILPKDLEEHLMIFTTPHFSLHGVSKVVAEDRTVLHVYADDESLVMTVSRGEEVLYTRGLRIPPYTKTDEEAYTDFIHENISMTYMFVAQRSNIPVDFILLSGKLYEKEALINELIPSVSCGIATPLVPREFRKAGPIVFLEFLPCFGTVLLDQRYDFSPNEVKDKRALRLHLSKLIPVLTLLLVLALSMVSFEIYKLWERSKEIAQLRGRVISSLSALTQDPLLREGDLNYYVAYLNLLARSRRENPLNAIPQIEDFLKEIKANEYIFSYTKGKIVLSFTVERQFRNLVALSIYREKLLKRLEEIKSRGFVYRIESEKRDLKENRLYIRIVLEKKV